MSDPVPNDIANGANRRSYDIFSHKYSWALFGFGVGAVAGLALGYYTENERLKKEHSEKLKKQDDLIDALCERLKTNRADLLREAYSTAKQSPGKALS